MSAQIALGYGMSMLITPMENRPPRLWQSDSAIQIVSIFSRGGIGIGQLIGGSDANLFKSAFEDAQTANANLAGAAEPETSLGTAPVPVNVSSPNLLKMRGIRADVLL